MKVRVSYFEFRAESSAPNTSMTSWISKYFLHFHHTDSMEFPKTRSVKSLATKERIAINFNQWIIRWALPGAFEIYEVTMIWSGNFKAAEHAQYTHTCIRKMVLPPVFSFCTFSRLSSMSLQCFWYCESVVYWCEENGFAFQCPFNETELHHQCNTRP